MPRVGITVDGKYVLQTPIGEGAMGSVWKAVHQTLGRPFAVKFLKAYGNTADRLEERFLQEARLAAAVQHRFVVSIVDFGLTDEGTAYMVMEYLAGESLGTRIAHGPALPARELLRIMAQALVGLEAVHQAGIIHRDLKPENIMLVAEAGGAIPKLVDFGISRPVAPAADGQQKLTAPGMTLGTPWYMAPEQVRFDADVDRRSDLYSAGIILYEALLGRLPYEDQDVLRLLDRVAHGGAEPLLAVRPELGPFVSALVERAMRVDPHERFANASEMAAALFSILNQVPEGLTCPVRGSDEDDRTRAVAPAPAPIIPAESEVPAEMLKGRLLVPGETTKPVRRRRSRALSTLVVAGGVLALASTLWLLRPNASPRTPAAMRLAEPGPTIVPLPLPAPATRAGAEAVRTPGLVGTDPPLDEARRRPRRGRDGVQPKATRHPTQPPEVFTHPGF